MVLAVASGKGGTGKTTLAVNLAYIIEKENSTQNYQREADRRLVLLDCDVEEPNIHLFLPHLFPRINRPQNSPGRHIPHRMTGKAASESVTILVPEVDETLCNGCGECGKFCEYNAIVSFGTAPLVFPEMCHGCGGCTLVCPQKAIREVDRDIGTITITPGGGITLVEGNLSVGYAMAPPVIRQVKSRMRTYLHEVTSPATCIKAIETTSPATCIKAIETTSPAFSETACSEGVMGGDFPRNGGITAIIDSPPGTSCPVIETVRDVDFVLLVAEPTLFGLNDFKLIVEMALRLGVPFGAVVNRYGIGNNCVHEYCLEQGIPVLGEIPDDRRIAEVCSRGELVVASLPEYAALFAAIISNIMRSIKDAP